MSQENEEPQAAGGAAVPQKVYVPTNIPFPAKLDIRGNLATNWRHFKRVWENYEIATGLKDKDDELRVATLLTCIGGDALSVYDGLKFQNDEDRKNIIKVLQVLDFCIGQTNEIYERYTFNKREQEVNETIDSYVASLRSLVKTCRFGGLEEEMIRDRIVLGIRDNHTRKKLLQEKKLDLQRCVDICRASEKSNSQLRVIEEVQFVKKSTKTMSDKQRKDSRDKQEIICEYCGFRHRKEKTECPAYGKECAACGRKNHFARKCTQKTSRKQKKPRPGKKPHTKKSVHNVNDYSSSSDYEYVLTVEEVHSVSKKKKITAQMVINNQTVQFQVDCGSSVNILPETLYKKLCNDPENLTEANTCMTLVMFNKSETKPLGKRRLTIRNPRNRKKCSIEFVIVAGTDLRPILEVSAVQAMKLITVNEENFVAQITGKSDTVEPLTKEQL